MRSKGVLILAGGVTAFFLLVLVMFGLARQVDGIRWLGLLEAGIRPHSSVFEAMLMSHGDGGDVWLGLLVDTEARRRCSRWPGWPIHRIEGSEMEKMDTGRIGHWCVP